MTKNVMDLIKVYNPECQTLAGTLAFEEQQKEAVDFFFNVEA